ncbi:PKD domain-containing protein [Aurantibacillus circumpalustris]|uniref:PKD domain-containing protein n=1 Tax=Aurantibacillus circumpalustris TaxID=3036359 RepID=UPI00295AAE1D|nr:PKD domain-containing protein [Aurantibacillus circumpalustris]
MKSRSQIDTSFWFVAPDVPANMGDFPIVLHFQTYSQPTIIYIQQPALVGPSAINVSVAVAANTTYTLDITANISVVESGPANSANPFGIYISSKENISVYYTFDRQSVGIKNREMISLKGRRALGRDFYASVPASASILTYTVNGGGVGFDVVATQTGITTVLITPKASCVGHAKNATFVKTLNRGETFSVLDTNTLNFSELAGSIVSADRDIAVTVKGSIRTTSTCPSYFADQITPSNHLGKDYVVLKGNGTEDIAYILAPLNSTSFTITTSSGATPWLINATETYSINISDPIAYIHSDKPIYVFHLSGYGCKLSGAQMAPVSCAGSYSAAFIRLSSDSLNLNISTRSGFQSSFTLTSNGVNVPISSTSFTTVPGSGGNLVTARIYLPTSSVSVGSYNELVNPADIFGLSVSNGGYLAGSAYAQASDFEISSFAYANSAPTATICGNTQFTLSGIVGGGPITGVWSILQGYGTLSSGNTQLTNNIYTPSLLDTTNNALSIPINNRYVKFILSSTGICPNTSDTFQLHVKQPPIVSAGSSSIICGNNPILHLNGNVFGATNQGVWNVKAPGSGTFVSGINSFTPTYQLSSSDTTLSQLYFILTSTNNAGCNAVNDSVLIIINKAPLIKASTINPIIKCSNNATVSLNGLISGTTTSTGIWQTNGTGIFSPNNVALSTNYIPSINDVAMPNLKLYLESTNNGACFSVKDSVSILFTEPSYANAGGDVNACVNDPRGVLSGAVTGTVTNTGLWSGGSGSFLPSNSVLTATYIGTPSEVLTGFVTLTLTSSNNGLCLSTSDVVRVNFQSKPFANYSVTSVCLGKLTDFGDQSVNLSGVGVLKSWKWDFGDNSAPSTLLYPSHTYSNVGTFSAQLIVINSFNCADTVIKPVVIYELPNVNFSFSRSCSGSAQLILFKDNSSIAAPSTILPGGHFWDFGGFGFSNSVDTSVVFPSEGLYSITHIVTSNKGCQSVISKSVNITPRPVAKFVHINNSIAGLGANVLFRDTSSYAESWTWDFGNGETSNLKYPSTFYNQNGLYVVTLKITDLFGCPSTFTSEIRISTIVSDIVKLIPNIVTPNDDGKNDLWRLEFIDVYFPTAEIEIYNRWGVRIFKSIGYKNAWDGSYLGDPLPVGAYFYTINLHDKDNTPVIKGTLTLIK